MSYCRFNDGTNPIYGGASDVYIFNTSVNGKDIIECCGCWLNDPPFAYGTEEEMLIHIAEHRAAGHVVPEHVDEALKQEIADRK